MCTIKVRNRPGLVPSVEDKDRQREFEGAEDARRAARLVNKWQAGGAANRLGERQGAQSHFLDLCELLRVDRPEDPDNYCFERGDKGLAKQQLFADVWKRQCFAWEFKRPGGDLRKALDKLMQYAMALDNPPLLIVSDRQIIEIHTHFTGYPTLKTVFTIADLEDAAVRARLRSAFNTPEDFKPDRSNADITRELAGSFADMADRLRRRGIAPEDAAHFLIQCLFGFFAEGIGALPNQVFSSLVQKKKTPQTLRSAIRNLFETMKDGGEFGVESIAYFNGGLYNTINIPEIDQQDLDDLLAASKASWASLDPAILGTLFERGLDPDKRSQQGTHFTDAATIEKIIDPVIRQPLLQEWAMVRGEIAILMGGRDLAEIRARSVPSAPERLKKRHAGLKAQAALAHRKAKGLLRGFLHRLRDFRVLDPASGSGNFLYLALKALKDVEHQVNLDATEEGLERSFPMTGPWNVQGIEVNDFAAELARVTVWIAELQWMKQHGFRWKTDPVLDSLEHIVCRDALLNVDGKEAKWPRADVVVSNPPFLGGSKFLRELGPDYSKALRLRYNGRVQGGANLVCYWFEKSCEALRSGAAQRCGLVATSAIRAGSNRMSLKGISEVGHIFNAWSDEEWVNDGAAVRVSLVCFSGESDTNVMPPMLDGLEVTSIRSNLTAVKSPDQAAADPTKAVRLAENSNCGFEGTKKYGPFDIDGDLARKWLLAPNPNGRPNSDVVRPWANGKDIVNRSADKWIIDFGIGMSKQEASMYEAPFAYTELRVKPARTDARWWLHERPRPEMRKALHGLGRYIATSRVSKHRLFVWLDSKTLPDSRLFVIACDDNCLFGVLHSRIHELWTLATCSWHGVGNAPTYNAASCFETFPFPINISVSRRSKRAADNLAERNVGRAAQALNEARDRWLSPSEWVQRSPEVVPDHPVRILARPGHEIELKRRTLTMLYNERPAWLANLHENLDMAVAAAYGWKWPMDDAEILKRLFALNQEKAALPHDPGAVVAC